MNIIELPHYTSFTSLISHLLYLHKTNTIYTQAFDPQAKNSISIFYDKETRTYNFSFKLLDKKVQDAFIKVKKNLEFFELRNKEQFLDSLRNKIEELIFIMQQNGYKFSYKPEITIQDLEHIDELLGLDPLDAFDEKEVEEESSTKKLINSVLIFHSILASNLERFPYEKNDVIKIRIKDIDHENIDLFPPEDVLLFTNVTVNTNISPNLYFSQIVSLNLVKDFEINGTRFQIVYSWNILLKKLWLLTKYYYKNYKEKAERNESFLPPHQLEFCKSLLSIIKNPYNSDNFDSRTTSSSIITKSQCKKCGSKSWLFSMLLTNVLVKVKMWTFEEGKLYPNNIISYDDILEITCNECSNPLISNIKKINNIIELRNELNSEDWIHPETGLPILDTTEWREILVIYDTLKVQTTFDTTKPLLPEMSYKKILSTWEIIWWIDPETNNKTSFL